VTSHNKVNPLDGILLVAILAGAAFVAYRISDQLEYTWNWSVIPQYLFRYDAGRGGYVANLLMLGLYTTIRLSIWSTLLACLIGLTMGLFRISGSLFLRLIGRTYVEAIRNLPPLVLIFIFYFFVSDQIIPVLGVDALERPGSSFAENALTFLFAPPGQISGFLSAVITLALYEGAYITEIVRAGIESVDRRQWEAAYALGLSRPQQIRHVILPQALPRIIPPLTGQFISAIKDSSIVSVISIQELTYQGQQLVATTYMIFEVWITVAVLYFALTFLCSMAAQRVERLMMARAG